MQTWTALNIGMYFFDTPSCQRVYLPSREKIECLSVNLMTGFTYTLPNQALLDIIVRFRTAGVINT